MTKLILFGAVVLFVACKAMPVYYSPQRTESGSTAIPSVKCTDSSSTVVSETTAVASGSADREQALLEEIRTWIGTPYAFGMISKGKGVDCSGFVGHVFDKVMGIRLPRQASEMYAEGKPIGPAELETGDLIFLQNTYKGATGASHVGIYVGNGRMAHASTTVGVTISSLDEAYYVKHLLGYRRVLP